MKNTEQGYGVITIVLHWLVTVMVVGLFVLGLWMVDLGYYDPWYKTGPMIHKSVGICLFILMVLRLVWKYAQTSPLPIKSHSETEIKLAKIMQLSLYVMLFILMVSGYLISTADGRAIAVFDVIQIPSMGELIDQQEDIAGVVHEYLAYTLILAVLMHGGAALKHHFIDKDNTLLRMLGQSK